MKWYCESRYLDSIPILLNPLDLLKLLYWSAKRGDKTEISARSRVANPESIDSQGKIL